MTASTQSDGSAFVAVKGKARLASAVGVEPLPSGHSRLTGKDEQARDSAEASTSWRISNSLRSPLDATDRPGVPSSLSPGRPFKQVANV